MNKIIKFLEVLGKLVIIGFTMVLAFFGSAIIAGILKALIGIDITFGNASIIILIITIGSSILVFKKKEDINMVFVEEQEQEQEEYIHSQTEEFKFDTVEEYINYFGF